MWLYNEHFAKVRHLLGHITWVHIRAMFEEDLLNSSVVICKINFIQSGILHKTISHFGQNKTVKTLWPEVDIIQKERKVCW